MANQNQQVGRVAVLTISSIIAHGITFVSLPILTRNYGQAAFGDFFSFSTICWISAVVATMQFEHIIIQPKTNARAIILLEILIALSVLVAILIGATHAVFYSLNPSVNGIQNENLLRSSVLCLTILGIGLNQGLRSWYIRVGDFNRLAIGTILTASGSGVLGTLASTSDSLTVQTFGLMFSQTVGLYVTAVYWWPRKGGQLKFIIRKLWLAKYKIILRQYLRQSSILVASNIIKTANSRLGPLIVLTVAGPAMAGDYGLAERVVSAPTTLLAKAMASVFRNQVGYAESTANRAEALKRYWQYVRYALYIGIPMFSIGALISPLIFVKFFGEKWAYSGKIAAILMFGELFSFTITTVEDASVLIGNNRFRLLWHISQILATLLLFALVVRIKPMEIEIVFLMMVSIKAIFAIVEMAYFKYQQKFAINDK